MKARVLALYLPQYHPIPENDQWWGKGFTEWTNVGKAKHYFPGHYQPRVPADLGYYDLRVPEVREAQAELARQYGVEGFIYWHYWFGNGKRLLERPFNEVLATGRPDFPFALAWANESWKGFAHGLMNRNTLIEQLYPGEEDYIAHFYEILPAFKDKRYITVDGKPIFMIYKPEQIPDVKSFIALWQRLAQENGLKGIYFIAHSQHTHDPKDITTYLELGYDRVYYVQLSAFFEELSFSTKAIGKSISRIFRLPRITRYKTFIKHHSHNIGQNPVYIPSIVPGWDHTPRSKHEGILTHHSTPALFEKHVRQVVESVQNIPMDERLIFIKSWNEWAEGNYMEPDLRWGHAYLEALKQVIE